MEKNGELDSSGFILINKNQGDKLSPTKTKSATKHPELKLWICDLLTIRRGTQENQIEFYNFRGLSVNIVYTFGVVTEVSTNRFGVLYKVDDGTGSIGCWHDYRKIVRKETLEQRLDRVMTGILGRNPDSDENNTSIFVDPNNSAAPQRPNLMEAAQWLESRVREYTDTKKKTLFVLGDSVIVRGKLVDFRGERCIRIYNIQLTRNINEETDRRFELLHLYESFYSKQGHT